MPNESWDVVVVGSGPGGLTAAACLAATGRRVLVTEAHDVAGGNAQVFRRHPRRGSAAATPTSSTSASTTWATLDPAGCSPRSSAPSAWAIACASVRSTPTGSTRSAFPTSRSGSPPTGRPTSNASWMPSPANAPGWNAASRCCAPSPPRRALA
ncbi:MAG: NAD(P)-binding protein [Actinobacteria bacterium]|nr:NAD(P)-binding protein [Actinomycetota bacterium]